MLLTQLRRAVVLAVIAFVFVFVYALVGTGLSQLLFKDQASGSITANGSTMIGQSWSGTKWFHGRPDSDDPLSANGTAGESGATNLGPRSKTLVVDTRKLIEACTRSASTRRRTWSPPRAAASTRHHPGRRHRQIPMIVRSRGVTSAQLQSLIARETHSAQFGFLGSPYIVVLQLNEALASLR